MELGVFSTGVGSCFIAWPIHAWVELRVVRWSFCWYVSGLIYQQYAECYVFENPCRSGFFWRAHFVHTMGDLSYLVWSWPLLISSGMYSELPLKHCQYKTPNNTKVDQHHTHNILKWSLLLNKVFPSPHTPLRFIYLIKDSPDGMLFTLSPYFR